MRVKNAADYRTFARKADAVAWAAARETELREGAAGKPPDKTFADAMRRFIEDECPKRRYGARERLVILRFIAAPLGGVRVAAISAADVARWRDARLARVSAATVCREMNLLSAICSTALREWQWLRTNPVSGVRRPETPRGRDRRIRPEEVDRICHALGYDPDKTPATKSARVGAAFLFAIETAMRAGEIVALTRADIDFDQRTAHVRGVQPGAGKSDAARRHVPLSAAAMRILRQLPPSPDLFALGNADQMGALFRAGRDRADIRDLHFHDTRHEAITRLSRKMDVLALARSIGHRDLKMLMVYYNESAADIARRLD